MCYTRPSHSLVAFYVRFIGAVSNTRPVYCTVQLMQSRDR